MKHGSEQKSAIAFVAFLVVLSAGARLLRSDPPPVVPADAAGLDLPAYQARAQHALDTKAARERPLGPDEQIAVNSAGVDALMRLPGVGPSLAARIVAERKRSGGFRTTAELTRVRGIGERTARTLAKHIDFSGAGPRGPASAVASSGARAALPVPASRYDAPARGEGPGTAVPPGGHASGRRDALAGDAAPTVVDVNRASMTELQRLHGIGPALARRIIAYRDSAGPFRSVDQLVEVPGIGPATLKRIRPAVRAGGG